MENFSDYILSEKNYLKKLEIAYYLSKKENIFFDNSVVFKTELARMFIDTMNIDVDKNMVLTACILCACKKPKEARNLDKIKTYAIEGAEYLKTLGFSDRFCKICSEINRYNEIEEREKESDILELVDCFGGMLLHRPEREGFKVDEALVLLEERNLKGKDNMYLGEFKKFVNAMEEIKI